MLIQKKSLQRERETKKLYASSGGWDGGTVQLDGGTVQLVGGTVQLDMRWQ